MVVRGDVAEDDIGEAAVVLQDVIEVIGADGHGRLEFAVAAGAIAARKDILSEVGGFASAAAVVIRGELGGRHRRDGKLVNKVRVAGAVLLPGLRWRILRVGGAGPVVRDGKLADRAGGKWR